MHQVGGRQAAGLHLLLELGAQAPRHGEVQRLAVGVADQQELLVVGVGAEGGELGAVHGDGDQLVRAVAVGGLVDRLAQGLARLRGQIVAAGPQADDQSRVLPGGPSASGSSAPAPTPGPRRRGRAARRPRPGRTIQPSGRITSCSHRRGSGLRLRAVAGVPVQAGLGAPGHQAPLVDADVALAEQRQVAGELRAVVARQPLRAQQRAAVALQLVEPLAHFVEVAVAVERHHVGVAFAAQPDLGRVVIPEERAHGQRLPRIARRAPNGTPPPPAAGSPWGGRRRARCTGPTPAPGGRCRSSPPGR